MGLTFAIIGFAIWSDLPKHNQLTTQLKPTQWYNNTIIAGLT